MRFAAAAIPVSGELLPTVDRLTDPDADQLPVQPMFCTVVAPLVTLLVLLLVPVLVPVLAFVPAVVSFCPVTVFDVPMPSPFGVAAKPAPRTGPPKLPSQESDNPRL